VIIASPIIADTNILFSALLGGESSFGHVLLDAEHSFYVCESVLVELFKRKDKIVAHSRLTEEDVVRAYHVLLRHVNLFKEALISAEHWREAYRLCCDIDATDTPHVALTLTLDGRLWTGDKRLVEGLKRKGFSRFFVPEQSGSSASPHS
jgi:predicted nucleic acid-binding protein